MLFEELDEEQRLMMRVKDGDEEAFRILFKKYRGKIMRYASFIIGDPSLAEDVAQDVFVNLFVSRKRYRPLSSFRAYIYKIAHNLCINFLKSRRYKEKLHFPLESMNRSELSDSEDYSFHEKREKIGVLREELRNLPDRQRSAIELAILEGLSYEEIGHVLGCSANAAKILVFRAKEKLSERLRSGKKV